MTLTASEKAAVLSLWNKIAPQASALGAETFTRLFMTFPQSKTYFTHFDLTPGSADLINHGAKIMNALGNAANHLDDLAGALSTLSDLHAYNLRMYPGNFGLLSHTIQVVFAIHFPSDFTPEVQAAWDKFIHEVAALLINPSSIVGNISNYSN